MTAALPAAAEIEAAREQASERWRAALAGAGEGWSVASLDLGPVLSPFGVGVRPGWELVVLTYRWGRDGEGRVLAVAAAAAEDVRRRLAAAFEEDEEHELEEPPAVPEAAADVGAGLAGERTDRGLLMASLAAHELAEVGAFGHGAAWLDERVLEGHGALPDLAPGWGAPDAAGAWTWHEPPAEDWSAAVTWLDATPTVRFFTYDPVGGHEIARHVDHYRRDGLAASRARTVVASAPGGIIR